MFESLSDSLSNIFTRLKGKGHLTEEDVGTALREIRVALLEADVALPVVKDLTAAIREKAIGEEVVKSVSPGQMVVKIVHDHLTSVLGSEHSEIDLNAKPPVVIMMAGLQGSGKTTSSAKLALWLRTKKNKNPLLASLDIYRPAAREQLETLGKQLGIASVPIKQKESPLEITKRALEMARAENHDIVILDTAGRLHIDDDLMNELEQVKKFASPHEILLVADSLTGQDAVKIAESFHQKLSLTGIILTRIDGDGRGGAALSMRAVTGCPIKFLGTGEKPSEFEPFHPERIASRILGMGDVVTLVEKAVEQVDKAEAEKLAKKMRKGEFTLDDLSDQIDKIKKMGGVGGMMGMLPGMGKLKQKLGDAELDESVLDKQQAIISSMTKKERANPELFNASRKRRVAEGSGSSIQEVNRLLKQFRQMKDMMRKFSKLDKKAMARGGMQSLLSRFQ